MISDERRQELEFMVRIKAHLSLRESMGENREPPENYEDFYTMRELVDCDIFQLINIEDGEIILRAKHEIYISKVGEGFDAEMVEEGREFVMTTNSRLYSDFLDLM